MSQQTWPATFRCVTACRQRDQNAFCTAPRVARLLTSSCQSLRTVTVMTAKNSLIKWLIIVTLHCVPCPTIGTILLLLLLLLMMMMMMMCYTAIKVMCFDYVTLCRAARACASQPMCAECSFRSHQNRLFFLSEWGWETKVFHSHALRQQWSFAPLTALAWVCSMHDIFK